MRASSVANRLRLWRDGIAVSLPSGGVMDEDSLDRQLPCFGVQGHSNRPASRLALSAGKASYDDAGLRVSRLSRAATIFLAFGPGVDVGAIDPKDLTDELNVPMHELRVAIRMPEELQSAHWLTFDFSDGSFLVASDCFLLFSPALRTQAGSRTQGIFPSNYERARIERV